MNTFDADFATAQSNTPLPIELILFEARSTTEGVLTSWTTASEINNDFFTIERSYDGKNFFPIGTVDGAGNSTQERNYHFTDKNPGKGLIYYRLKQTDFDQQFSYSETVAVKVNEKIAGLNLFPNPVESQLHYQFESSGEPVSIQIVDVTGRVLYTEEKTFKAGVANSEIDLQEFSNGMYFLVLSCDGSMSKNWFVKKN
jgi:hypothetical protein